MTGRGQILAGPALISAALSGCVTAAPPPDTDVFGAFAAEALPPDEAALAAFCLRDHSTAADLASLAGADPARLTTSDRQRVVSIMRRPEVRNCIAVGAAESTN